jgi:hypothetical protein
MLALTKNHKQRNAIGMITAGAAGCCSINRCRFMDAS